MSPGINAALGILDRLVDRFVPDPKQAAKEKAAIRESTLDELKLVLGVILAEANSSDPWTSRARPGFLYVIYVYLLAALPVGFANIWAPYAVERFIAGVTLFLASIPGELLTLFAVGYLGYGGYRTAEKFKFSNNLTSIFKAGNEPDASGPVWARLAIGARSNEGARKR